VKQFVDFEDDNDESQKGGLGRLKSQKGKEPGANQNSNPSMKTSTKQVDKQGSRKEVE